MFLEGLNVLYVIRLPHSVTSKFGKMRQNTVIDP